MSKALDASNHASLNQAIEYFLDSLIGRSAQTKTAYTLDLQQFKLYLVFYRPHLVIRGGDEERQELRRQLERSNGKLIDTRHMRQNHKETLRPRALLDAFDCDISQLDRQDAVGYFGYLESEKGLSSNTLCRRLASLRRFARLLLKEGWPILPGFADKLEDMEIRRERQLPIALEREEALDFLSVIEDARDRAIVLVMLFMGLRISEVVRLNVDDIAPGIQGITLKGKGAKERYVPIHPVVMDAIEDYKANVRKDAPEDEHGRPLFVSQHRRRLDPSTVRRMIKRYAQMTEELPSRKRRRLSPHKLRHTFATLLLQNAVDIRHIQELLGHQNLSTTQIYTQVAHRDLERAIGKHPLG